MNKINKILIGGKALMALGSSRDSADLDYLVDLPESREVFLHEPGVDYCNAAAHNFFKAVWDAETAGGIVPQIASPQALLELKSWAFVQHCQNFKFQKADDAEYDMKFLVRKFNLTGVSIVKNFLHSGELAEVEKIINSVKK